MIDDQAKKVRKLRDGGWYWIARKILRLYGRRLGTSGLAVYNVLACFARSETQSCFPSRKAVAQMLGMSRRTVTRKIRLLEELGLVRVEKRGNSYRYLLLAAGKEVTQETPGGDKQSTFKETAGNTNDNKLTRVNNIDIEGKEFSGAHNSFKPDTREKMLAQDLAQALDDERNIPFYLSCTRKYPESFLRRVLGEVKEVPVENIKKGRAALFNYLVQKYAKQQKQNPGH